MNESGHTQAINKKVKAAGVYTLKIQTMMNNGVPDCWYSGNKADLWVEMKYISKLPKKLTTEIKINLSDLQYEWLTNRYVERRNVAVVIGSEKGWYIATAPSLWSTPILQKDLTKTRNEIIKWIIKQTNA
jgi:hypothetical protein